MVLITVSPKSLRRASQLAEAKLGKFPNDADAEFASVMVHGLRSDYLGLIERNLLSSLSEAKQGRILADRLLLDRRHELADDFERDISFEQSDAHLAQGELDVLFAQPAFATEAIEDGLQFFGEGFEHNGEGLGKIRV